MNATYVESTRKRVREAPMEIGDKTVLALLRGRYVRTLRGRVTMNDQVSCKQDSGDNENHPNVFFHTISL
jgi:hypothetical protein